jgi:hypothetical protein
MTNVSIKGAIAKIFWVMLGCAFIIVSVGMAWSLVIRGFCTVNLSAKKNIHSLTQADGEYAKDTPVPMVPIKDLAP